MILRKIETIALMFCIFFVWTPSQIFAGTGDDCLVIFDPPGWNHYQSRNYFNHYVSTGYFYNGEKIFKGPLQQCLGCKWVTPSTGPSNAYCMLIAYKYSAKSQSWTYAFYLNDVQGVFEGAQESWMNLPGIHMPFAAKDQFVANLPSDCSALLPQKPLERDNQDTGKTCPMEPVN